MASFHRKRLSTCRRAPSANPILFPPAGLRCRTTLLTGRRSRPRSTTTTATPALPGVHSAERRCRRNSTRVCGATVGWDSLDAPNATPPPTRTRSLSLQRAGKAPQAVQITGPGQLEMQVREDRAKRCCEQHASHRISEARLRPPQALPAKSTRTASCRRTLAGASTRLRGRC
jgi:hypothetical protein